jgi:hypothetical protein
MCVIEPIHIPERGVRRWGKRRWDKDLEFIAKQQGKISAIESSQPSERTVSMVCLGRHGRWGNTLMQYVFLRTFALKHSLRCETPKWVGTHLFGLADPPVRHCYSNVVIDNISKIYDPDNHFDWPMSKSQQRAWYLAKTLGRNPFQIHVTSQKDHEGTRLPFLNADLEGLFMIHTGHLKNRRKYLRSLIKPCPDIQYFLKPCVERLRARGKTLIGVHLRREDFITSAMGQNFELVTPVSTYIRWLKSIWASLSEPILFISSDDIDSVMSAFADFNPITSKDLYAEIPPYMKALDLSPNQLVQTVDFFPDWYLLTQCDILAISNSTFSFTAAMFSEHGYMFMRPTFNDKELVPFDPWDSEPLLFAPHQRWIIDEFSQRLQFHSRDLKKSALVREYAMIIVHYFRLLRARAKACIRFQGWISLFKSLFTPKFYLHSRVRYDK